MNGDEPLTDAQRDLAGLHAGLARGMARRFAYVVNGDLDAAWSAAQVGLMDAARLYEPAKAEGPDGFKRYAARRIYGEIVDEMRRLRPRGFRRVRTENGDPAPTVLPLLDTAIDMLAPDPEPDLDAREAFDHLLGMTPAPQRRVLRMLYAEGFTPTTAAPVLGVTQTRVSQIRSAALGRLRLRLGVSA